MSSSTNPSPAFPPVVYASYNRLIARKPLLKLSRLTLVADLCSACPLETTLHVLEPFSVEPPRQQSRSLNGPLNRPAPVKSSYRPFAQAFVPGSVLNINFFDKNLFLFVYFSSSRPSSSVLSSSLPSAVPPIAASSS